MPGQVHIPTEAAADWGGGTGSDSVSTLTFFLAGDDDAPAALVRRAAAAVLPMITARRNATESIQELKVSALTAMTQLLRACEVYAVAHYSDSCVTPLIHVCKMNSSESAPLLSDHS